MSPQIPDLSQVPTKVVVQVNTFQKGDTRFTISDRSGKVPPAAHAMTLRRFRELHGADEAQMLDPFKKETHRVSLQGQQLGDPDQTMVQVVFKLVPLMRVKVTRQ